MTRANRTVKGLVHVTGLDTVSGVLNQIPADLRTDITAAVVKAGSVPVQVAAKRFAKRSERTGALREAIGTVVRKYKHDATAVAVVGVLRGYYKGRKKLGKDADRRGSESPSHYAHLVEFGHHAVTGGKGRDVYARKLVGIGRYSKNGKELKRWVRGEVVKKATGRVVGWVPAKPFLRPAFVTTKAQVLREMTKELERALARTRKRGIKQGWHKAA